MSGPCMCGDPYCPRCGNPHAAKVEAAAEALMDRLHELRCEPEDYEMVGRIAEAVLAECRRAVVDYSNARQAEEAEANEARRMDAEAEQYYSEQMRESQGQ